jgi:hypothetical protein
VTKLFQSPCLPKEMVRSLDATFRAGDDRVPVDGTLQYRWGKSMQDTMPHRGQNIVTEVGSRYTHPQSENASPFYMTGGTKRSHVKE